MYRYSSMGPIVPDRPVQTVSPPAPNEDEGGLLNLALKGETHVKKSLFVAAVVLASAVMTAPPVFAAVAAPSCADAQLAFNRAQDALDDAVADDEAAADAKAADEELDRAKAALVVANDALGVARADVATKQARLDALKKVEPPDDDAIADAQAALDAAKEVQATAQSKATAAQSRVTTAETAAKTDAAALQDIADKTNAGTLEDVRDDAREAADKACGRVTTTPQVPNPDVDCGEVSDAEAQRILDADRSDPNNLDTDNDGIACEDDEVLNPPPSVTVVVPRGGVATGGGPA